MPTRFRILVYLRSAPSRDPFVGQREFTAPARPGPRQRYSYPDNEVKLYKQVTIAALNRRVAVNIVITYYYYYYYATEERAPVADPGCNMRAEWGGAKY